MKKYSKIIILVVIVIIIGVICGIVYNHSQKGKEVETSSENEIENVIEENTVENNEIENEVEEEKVQEPEENTVEENKVQENAVKEEASLPEDYKPEVSSTNKKEEAINLVKEKWGEDDSVKFRCDSITSDGEYIIAVILKSTAKVQNYFRVNLEKKEVYVHY